MSSEIDPGVVWSNTVDQGTFKTEVTRKGAYTGQYRVTVVETGEVLLDEEVGLAYDAIFGPDVADVADWEDRGIKVIDEWIERQKRT